MPEGSSRSPSEVTRSSASRAVAVTASTVRPSRTRPATTNGRSASGPVRSRARSAPPRASASASASTGSARTASARPVSGTAGLLEAGTDNTTNPCRAGEGVGNDPTHPAVGGRSARTRPRSGGRVPGLQTVGGCWNRQLQGEVRRGCGCFPASGLLPDLALESPPRMVRNRTFSARNHAVSDQSTTPFRCRCRRPGSSRNPGVPRPVAAISAATYGPQAACGALEARRRGA